jgi:transposase
MDLVLSPCKSAGSRRCPAAREVITFRKPKLDVRQPELVPFGSILDFLEPEDPTFWLLDLQESLPLSLFPEGSRSGGYDYDPRMMFTLWLLALWCDVGSSRKLELAVRRDVRFIALAHGLRPDHSTFCRFRLSLGAHMCFLLAESVERAVKAGMVGFKRGHIDGQRLPGNVSQWRKLCEAAQAEDFADGTDRPPPSDDSGSKRLAAKKLKRVDTDARTIKTKKGYITGYNAQALADEEFGIVLSATVSNNANDSAELEPNLAQCLEVNAQLPDSIAGDTGYDTSRNAYALEELGVESFIPQSGFSVFSLSADERVVCPAGHEPNQIKRLMVRGLPIVRRVVTKCKTCPQASSCAQMEKSKSPNDNLPVQRTIQSPEGVPLAPWLRMHKRATSPLGKEAAKKRSCTVERVFAHSKERLGLRRFKLRGLELVELEWILQMAAHNFWRVQTAAFSPAYGSKGFDLAENVSRVGQTTASMQLHGLELPVAA